MLAGSEIQVAIGQKGWLFLDAFGKNRYLGTAKDLGEWKKTLLPKHVANYVARGRRVTERGIGFIVVIAPEAAGIYSECLPDGYKIELPTAGEILAESLSEQGLQVICPSSALRASKAVDLYCRLDSHWSYSGAYICYRQIVEQVRRHIPAVPVPWQRIQFGNTVGFGDLGVHTTPERQGNIQTLMIEGYDVLAGPNIFDHREKNVRRTSCLQGSGKALIFRDSFSNALAPFFERTFAETVLVAPSPTMMDSAIDAEKPDVVIFEVAERALFEAEHGFADWSARSFAQEYLELATNATGGRFQVDAVNHLLAGRPVEAIATAALAISLEGSEPRVYNLAWALQQAGHNKLCLELTEKFAVRLDDAFLWYIDAKAAFGLGDVVRAENSISRALQKRPSNALYLFFKGQLLKSQRRLGEALDAFAWSVHHAPLHRDSWTNLLEIVTEIGSDEAKKSYDAAASALGF